MYNIKEQLENSHKPRPQQLLTNLSLPHQLTALPQDLHIVRFGIRSLRVIRLFQLPALLLILLDQFGLGVFAIDIS